MARNPVLNEKTFRSVGTAPTEPMTLSGTIQKTTVLFGLALAAAAVSWSRTHVTPGGSLSGDAGVAVTIGGILAFALSWIISFGPRRAPLLAPVFALAEGVFLGVISRVYETAYHGIVPGAIFATLVTFAIMLLTYQTHLIKVNDRFRQVTQMAVYSVIAFSVISLIINALGAATPWLWNNSPLGYAISIVIIVVACMMLLSDFAMIDRGVAAQAPGYMEWYSGFALLVAVVWLYLEFLRLLSRMRQ